MLATLALVASSLPVASAADCNAKKMRADLLGASPVAVPRHYVNLVECDEKVALGVTEDALKLTLAGSDANRAIEQAIRIGAQKEVHVWLAGLEPDQRSRTIAALGKACGQEPAVQQFFVDAKGDLGAKFWEDRWFRGLADCRVEPIQGLLTEALDDPSVGRKANDRARFHGLLEVYARNLGVGAIPLIDELLDGTEDLKEVRLYVAAYSDAANVGSMEGTRPDASAKAVASLTERAPKLPPEVIDTVRDTLRALGAVDQADKTARYRWPERMNDGEYRYLAVASEIATCKNGKQVATFHYGELTEPGDFWPDALAERLEDRLKQSWGFELADKCKGEAEIVVAMTPAPIGGEESKWLEGQKTTFKGKTGGLKKAGETPHDPSPF